MSLIEQINKDYIDAVKSKDEVKKSVLNMLKSAVKYRQIDKGQELTDDDVIDVVRKEVKKRKESVEMYEKSGRMDLAEAERRELEILKSYLPPELSDDEIKEILVKIKEEQGLSGPADIGKMMKTAMQHLKGKADGSRVKKIAEEVLKS